MVIIGNRSGINDWNEEDARACVMQYTRKPTGTCYDFMCDYSLIGYVKDPEEQGRWAAQTALKVLHGTPVSDIPITRNSSFRLIVNKNIARSSGLSLPDTILGQAHQIIE